MRRRHRPGEEDPRELSQDERGVCRSTVRSWSGLWRVTYDGDMTEVSLGMPSVGGSVLLADPRGYCAGVDRAVITVEKALDLYGAPVYVRKQIVHNKHVVNNLSQRGAIFVEELDEVPEGATVVFSAHGVSPMVHAEAAERLHEKDVLRHRYR